MTTAAVNLWGRTIGAVTWDSSRDLGLFEYDPEFVRSAIEVAPLTMPLSTSIFSFPALPRPAFHGLPGLVADSLPDRFGNAVIGAWLATEGRTADSLNPVERLCYTGKRGMGALEFAPLRGPRAKTSQPIHVDALVRLAGDILASRETLSGSLDNDTTSDTMADILRVGTSAGGARAKAVIAWNPETQEVRSGQVAVDPGFSHWILKFDGVSENRDKELNDPDGYGAVEYAYHLMALAAGIDMAECSLLREGPRRHFMTRRFDRGPTGGKLHMQSLGALAHYDFNAAGACSYEQALDTMSRLEVPMADKEQQFRRMVFNVVARNHDDHVKNIAFLMNKAGTWRLSPAFDVNYAYNPDGMWTSRHQMTINGKRDGFTLNDFTACARHASLLRTLPTRVVEEVADAVSRWQEFAELAEVPEARAAAIGATHRLTSWA